MTERTLSNLIRASLFVAVVGFISIQTSWLDGVIPTRYAKIAFMTAYGVVPVLLMLKLISRLFLSGFKGQKLSFIENMFMLFYVLLTKEAREEWQSYIDEQKREMTDR